jgi:probable F420-dependent oxidoreductase
VKIRIGVGLGARTTAGDGPTFSAIVTGLERSGFDSLWLSERVNSPAPDPVVALSVAAGLTRDLKLGMSVMVLPGRNPVLVAKELATLDRLSGGRLLPAFGLGAVDPREQQAFGVERSARAALFDEALPLVRRLWTEGPVDHDGPAFTLEGIDVRPKPLQQPPDVWLGGAAPSELRRVGRLGDGWLASFCTPADVRSGLPVIAEEADRHHRSIDPEHVGALVLYRHGPVPPEVAALIARRHPGVEPGEVVPDGVGGLRAQLERFAAVGASKFVVVPVAEPPSPGAWQDELGRLAAALLPLQD